MYVSIGVSISAVWLVSLLLITFLGHNGIKDNSSTQLTGFSAFISHSVKLCFIHEGRVDAVVNIQLARIHIGWQKQIRF